ncbi:DNA-binding NarL/FixJ family response regulator [Saonia flava]|uniref:DNA-binding NarL/FixJ family response regulator n=1 Tax=Saonia flava TaxID=523696 RepID=A0A846QWU8_9FLAO|nr:response regulator transcription factor [Saonia flava]NJB69584.1 DNA-binding NarL/FixJ family response regulator [Saonia flava]
MRNLRILAVDDHEMTIIGYKYILEDIDFEDYKVHVDIANSYDLGKEKIEASSKSLYYDIIFLDIQMFTSEEKRPQTGEDLGILARTIVPESKVVFMSSFNDNYRINSILKSVNPDGYMVKSDIDPKSLRDLVNTVMTVPPYYSSKALVAIRKTMANDIVLDENDRKILYYISLGTKTKDIVSYVSISLPSIENRKRHLKTIFGIDKQNDLALITEAKKRGFI